MIQFRHIFFIEWVETKIIWKSVWRISETKPGERVETSCHLSAFAGESPSYSTDLFGEGLLESPTGAFKLMGFAGRDFPLKQKSSQQKKNDWLGVLKGYCSFFQEKTGSMIARWIQFCWEQWKVFKGTHLWKQRIQFAAWNFLYFLIQYTSSIKVTLPETKSSHLKIGWVLKRKTSYSNHPFSGANC